MRPSLTSLNRTQRWGLVLGVAAVIIATTYVTLPHRQWTQLQRLQDQQRQHRRRSLELTDIEGRLDRLQHQWQQNQEQWVELQSGCCTDLEARRFFENLNTWARDVNLLPVSRSLSPVTTLMNAPQGTVWTQGADVVLEGAFYDMMDYLDLLMDRPQRVILQSLRISMPPGQDRYPRMSFRVVLIITPEPEKDMA